VNNPEKVDFMQSHLHMVFYFAKHTSPIMIVSQLRSYTETKLTSYTTL